MQNKRELSFDVAKGIAILAVVFGHNGNVYLFSFLILPYFMSLFFFISGYFCGSGNLKTRIVKLYKNYGFYSTFLFVFSFCMESTTNPEATWQDKVLGFIYSRNQIFVGENEKVILCMDNHPLWFLSALMVATVLFYVVKKYINSNLKLILYCILSILISWVLTKLPILLPWSLDTMFIFAFFMLLGHKSKQNMWLTKINGLQYKLLIYILASFIYLFIIYNNQNFNIAIRMYGGNNSLSNVLFFVLQGILGIYLCIIACTHIASIWVGDILALVGRHTMSILCLYVFMYHVFSILIKDLNSSVIIKIIVNIVIIIICILVDLFMKKIINNINLNKSIV